MSPPNTRHWLSTDEMEVVVEVNPIGVIIHAPEEIHRFIGQPLRNLVLWMEKQPGFRVTLLEDKEET